MILTSPDTKRTVQDYDFTFIGGVVMPLTVDDSLGDTLTTQGDKIFISLTPKRSMNDPEKFLPAEEITIFVPQLLAIQQRARVVEDLTPEQKDAWQKTLQELSSTLQ